MEEFKVGDFVTSKGYSLHYGKIVGISDGCYHIQGWAKDAIKKTTFLFVESILKKATKPPKLDHVCDMVRSMIKVYGNVV
jgi:hypothetical protein